jgi:SulP family sulfate permease
MAIVIADVPAVHAADDPARALFTLSVLTGVVMLAAGFLRLGSVLRFVSNAVMVGFISAVGVNIILGQLANLTGYKAEGANRVVRAPSYIPANPPQSLAVGSDGRADTPAGAHRARPAGTGAGGVVTSALWPSWEGQRRPGQDLSEIPARYLAPDLMLRLVPSLVVPALSLAFVGLVRGRPSRPTRQPDSRYPDVSRDFIGQAPRT